MQPFRKADPIPKVVQFQSWPSALPSNAVSGVSSTARPRQWKPAKLRAEEARWSVHTCRAFAAKDSAQRQQSEPGRRLLLLPKVKLAVGLVHAIGQPPPARILLAL